MLQENRLVRSKVPSAFEPLLGPHTAKVDSAIEPGLTTLTWTAINILEYINNVHRALHQMSLLFDRINDLCEFRVDAILHEMSTICLCELPDSEPWTVKYFLERTQVCIKGVFMFIKQSHPR